MKDCHGNSSIQQEDFSHQQTGLKFKVETIKVLHAEHSLVLWCLRRLQKSVGRIMWKMKMY